MPISSRVVFVTRHTQVVFQRLPHHLRLLSRQPSRNNVVLSQVPYAVNPCNYVHRERS